MTVTETEKLAIVRLVRAHEVILSLQECALSVLDIEDRTCRPMVVVKRSPPVRVSWC
jgi:hypothetical protein